MSTGNPDLTRPLGVKIIAGLVGVTGIFGVFAFLFLALQAILDGQLLLSALIVLLVPVSFVLVVAAIGFWELSSRSWWIILVVTILSAIGDLAMGVVQQSDGGDAISFLLTILVLVYLLSIRSLYFEND